MIDLGLLDMEGASDPPVPAPRKYPPVPTPRKGLLAPAPWKCPALTPAPASTTVIWQPPIFTVRAPLVCHPPASLGLEYPSPPLPASETRTPPRHIDPSPVDPPAPPGSLIPPGSALVGCWPTIASGLLWLRLITPSHRLRWAPSSCQLLLGPCSLVALPWISWSPPRSPELSAPPWPPGSSTSPWLVGSLSPPRAPPPPALPPLVGSLESAPWSQQPSLLHGSFLRQLHHGPSSWLWPGSSCAPLPLPGPLCLFPGSSLLRCLPFLCLPPPSQVSSLLPSSHPSLPQVFLWHEDAPSGRGGAKYQDCELVSGVFCSPCVPCDPVSPSCWLLIWFRCVSSSSLIICVFKVL